MLKRTLITNARLRDGANVGNGNFSGDLEISLEEFISNLYMSALEKNSRILCVRWMRGKIRAFNFLICICKMTIMEHLYAFPVWESLIEIRIL
jgi:hypothetical protein